MPTEIQIPHWVQVVWNVQRFGNMQQYTFSYRTDPDIGSGITLDDLCAALWTRTVGVFPPLHTVGAQLNNIKAKTLYPQPNNFEGAYVPPVPLGGAAAGEAAPGNVALAVQYNSGLRGRTTHGRQFMGAFAEGSSNGDIATTGYMVALTDWVAAMLQSVLIDDYVFAPVIASRKDEALYSVTRAIFNSVLDSQRRRLTGRGD